MKLFNTKKKKNNKFISQVDSENRAKLRAHVMKNASGNMSLLRGKFVTKEDVDRIKAKNAAHSFV